MKAIVHDRYGPPDVLQFRDIAKPIPRDGEVLLRVHAAGVDPGVWHLMTGLPYLVRLMDGLRGPRGRVLGWDVAGVVEKVGGKVTGLRPGDEVFGTCSGSFAEWACARADKLAPRPRNLSLEQAAAIPVSATTALQALRDRGGVQPGQRVLIIGAAGGVGSFAVQIARALGAAVTGVCSTAKMDLVRSLGAEQVIDYTREEFADGRRRFDVIVDLAGNRPLSQLRPALAPRGTLVLVGGEGGGRWLGGMSRMLRAPLVSLPVRQRIRSHLSQARREDLLLLKNLVEDGKLFPVIDRTYRLSEVPEAVRRLAEGHGRGKMVIEVRRGDRHEQ